MGRPKKSIKRARRIVAYVTDAEREDIIRASDSTNLPVSRLVAIAVLEYLKSIKDEDGDDGAAT